MIINKDVVSQNIDHPDGTYTECTEAFVLGVEGGTGDLWIIMIGCPTDMFAGMVDDLEYQKDNIVVMVP